MIASTELVYDSLSSRIQWKIYYLLSIWYLIYLVFHQPQIGVINKTLFSFKSELYLWQVCILTFHKPIEPMQIDHWNVVSFNKICAMMCIISISYSIASCSFVKAGHKHGACLCALTINWEQRDKAKSLNLRPQRFNKINQNSLRLMIHSKK